MKAPTPPIAAASMSGDEPSALLAPLDGAALEAPAAAPLTADRMDDGPEAIASLTPEAADAADPVTRADEAEPEPDPAETDCMETDVDPTLAVDEPSEPTRRTGAAVTM